MMGEINGKSDYESVRFEGVEELTIAWETYDFSRETSSERWVPEGSADVRGATDA